MSQFQIRAKLWVNKTTNISSNQAQGTGEVMGQKWRSYGISDTHRLIYASIVRLQARGISADFITLCDDLELQGKLEEAGGASYLTSLINYVPTSGNAESYAQIVSRAALNRRLVHFAGQVASLAYVQDGKSLEKTEELLFSIEKHTMAGDFSTMSAMMTDYLSLLDKLHEHRGSLSGTPSGFRDIDAMTGGFQRSDLIILAGRPGMGKSSLSLSMAYNAASHGYKVAIFSLEMSKVQLEHRLMSMVSKINLAHLRSGWVDDDRWDDLLVHARDLSQLPIYVNDVPANPLASMRSQLRRLTRQYGQMDLIIVDYLGLVGPGEEKYENRVQEVSKISKGLKRLAREFEVPVLSLAQLSRAVEQTQTKTPQLSHLRDSGSIEEDSDLVMFIYRAAYYAQAEQLEQMSEADKCRADINVAKHRNGPTGDVALHFYPALTTFYDLEYELQTDQ
jgi:replicative DNA helicase